MNAYEFLYLIGRLRGISDAHLKALVESLIIVVQLKEHATKRITVYSGGNKRKLSIAVALLGMPPLIFLDEPYAGVDVIARHKIFEAINIMKTNSGSTFLLSSHDMEECEYSCDRIAIMKSGQIRCLGTLQHLREKFGQGYRFEFKLKHGASQDSKQFIEAVTEEFSGIDFAEECEVSYTDRCDI
ncbi:hypothetical protein HPB48_026604 [Haemaphysalis longicornis]|uniref:ATPase AAA-type core domain-containing protein n=1 Tax=Haemaphysalis longicornis TaxID=44386 RepID=A0A9J6HA87_HAELO|nr:hypothetical protein HPB48_026604 [Haemaphysalis longicornis]